MILGGDVTGIAGLFCLQFDLIDGSFFTLVKSFIVKFAVHPVPNIAFFPGDISGAVIWHAVEKVL